MASWQVGKVGMLACWHVGMLACWQDGRRGQEGSWAVGLEGRQSVPSIIGRPIDRHTVCRDHSILIEREREREREQTCTASVIYSLEHELNIS